jgi:TetR/AcrR family transcriptional regulator, tetracycline repressor protein
VANPEPEVGGRRARRSTRPGDAGLTSQVVARAALALIDEVGLEEFGPRPLAAELDVSTATIYWHVGGRDALIAAAVQAMFGELDLPRPSQLTWETDLRHTAGQVRDVVSRHPRIAPMVVTQLIAAAPAPRLADHVVELLEHAGAARSQIALLYDTVLGFLLGWVTVRHTVLPTGRDWDAQVEQQLRSLDPVEYPALTRHADALVGRGLMLRQEAGDVGRDEAFDTALDVLVAGLKGAIDARQRLRPHTRRSIP